MTPSPDTTPPDREAAVAPSAPDDARVLRVDERIAIPLHELTWRFTGSGGPGGQHANTANTRVELRYDVANSASLDARTRSRLIERLGPQVRVVVAAERSQARNRRLALERLAARLRGALATTAPRVPTRATRGSVERRLAAKQRRSQTKAQRRPPSLD